MTTAQFTSPIDSDTDANFRAWGSEISAQMAAVGLTQTADTGQIDWTTITIVGGYASVVGYEIWRFNDAGQSTAPIFMKIGYGASGSTSPVVSFQIGSGSDGAGTITGALKMAGYRSTSGLGNLIGTAYPSWVCYRAADGFFGMALKVGINSVPTGGFGILITRTNDTAGVVTADAFNCWIGIQPGSTMQGHAECPAAVVKFPASGDVLDPKPASWVYGSHSSFAGGNTQAMPLLIVAPEIQVTAHACGVIISEVPIGTTFSLNVVGLTPRTFVSVGTSFGDPILSDATYGTAMLWE